MIAMNKSVVKEMMFLTLRQEVTRGFVSFAFLHLLNTTPEIDQLLGNRAVSPRVNTYSMPPWGFSAEILRLN